MDLEKELINFSQRWDEAMMTNDPEEIQKFMSDDWVIVGTEGGITTKASFMQSVISGDLTHNRMDSDEMRVKIYGDTAVITSRGTSAGKYQGHSFERYEWSTSICIKVNQKWICVLTMLTPAAKNS